jgi:hypothetical protein
MCWKIGNASHPVRNTMIAKIMSTEDAQAARIHRNALSDQRLAPVARNWSLGASSGSVAVVFTRGTSFHADERATRRKLPGHPLELQSYVSMRS